MSILLRNYYGISITSYNAKDRILNDNLHSYTIFASAQKSTLHFPNHLPLRIVIFSWKNPRHFSLYLSLRLLDLILKRRIVAVPLFMLIFLFPSMIRFIFEIEPDQGELTRVVVEDIFDNLTRELYVHVPNVLPTLVDRLYLFLTYVIRLFLPYFTYPVESPFLLSPGSDDTIFDPDISAFYFSSLKLAASHRSGTFICVNVYPNILNEISMKICSSTCVVPNFTMIWDESS
ncbi:hypothetical protein Tco_1438231 [Tanacetum coccineum]